jgi:membrane fusion protein, multidrug efflux system
MKESKKKIPTWKAFKESYSQPEKRKKINTIAIVIIAVLLIIPKAIPILSAAISPLIYEEPEAELFSVDVVVAEAQLLDNTLKSTGTLRANQQIDLRTEVSGKVTGIYFDEGSRVSSGDLLLKINDNDLQADLARIRSNIEMTEETRERQQRLFERGGVTQEDYDATLMQLNNLRAEQAAIEVQIERTEVVAPFDGVVGLRYVDEGSFITTSTDIATLRDLNSVRIDFSIPERYAGQVETGSDVRFSVQGIDSVFTGEVAAIEPGIDPQSRTINIRAVCDNQEGLLRSGAFANIELILESFDGTIMIPSVALIPDMGQYKVMVYENGTVSEQIVETGIRNSENVQILNGLAQQDTVLVNGLLQVRDGMQVQIRDIVNHQD